MSVHGPDAIGVPTAVKCVIVSTIPKNKDVGDLIDRFRIPDVYVTDLRHCLDLLEHPLDDPVSFIGQTKRSPW